MANLQPNRFVLESNDGKTKVDYETSSIFGQASLNIQPVHGPIRHFSGRQIRRVETEIGALVTVTTAISVDTDQRRLAF
jgi:hypothetical protein